MSSISNIRIVVRPLEWVLPSLDVPGPQVRCYGPPGAAKELSLVMEEPDKHLSREAVSS